MQGTRPEYVYIMNVIQSRHGQTASGTTPFPHGRVSLSPDNLLS